MPSFPGYLKTLRIQLVGKQAVLSSEIGCTVAAVSYWEGGRRLPGKAMFDRIVSVLRSHGGDGAEISELIRYWEGEVSRRLVAERAFPEG